jgi:hypothetical protein
LDCYSLPARQPPQSPPQSEAESGAREALEEGSRGETAVASAYRRVEGGAEVEACLVQC